MNKKIYNNVFLQILHNNSMIFLKRNESHLFCLQKSKKLQSIILSKMGNINK